MKILIISPYLPYPLNSGGNQAVFAMIDYLRKKQDITFITTIHRNNKKHFHALQSLWPDVHFHPYYNSPNERMVHTVLAHYGGEPDTYTYRLLQKIERSVGRKMRRRRAAMTVQDAKRAKSSLNQYFSHCLSVSFLEFVSNEIQTGHYDIVQAEFYDLLPLAHIMPRTQTSVFVHHEIRFVRNQDEANQFPDQNILDSYFLETEKAQELAALEKFTHIITLSETDKQILKKELRNPRIHTSPAIIYSLKDTQFMPTSSELVFVGSEEHYPNRDAVEWFCREIAPLVKQPFTLHVVGKWSSRIKEQLRECPFLNFTGFVEDLSAFIRGKVMIVPIRIGSGIRMKILESIAAKTPFITTAKGVEGLDFQDKKECLIANDAHKFAEAIDFLLQNENLQESLQANAFVKLMTQYNPKNMLEQRNLLYEYIYTASHQNDHS